MEEENGEEVSGKEVERTSQLLATRLDKLHKELDSKNKIVSNYEAIQVEMDRKKEENKELKGRVFSLETATVLLQQELSVMRALHKQEKQATPLQSTHSVRSVSFQEISRPSSQRICMAITDCGENDVDQGVKEGCVSGTEAVTGGEEEVVVEIVNNKLQSIFDAEDITESRSIVPPSKCDGRKEGDKENYENESNKRDRKKEGGDSGPSREFAQEAE